MNQTAQNDDSILIQCPSCLTRFAVRQHVLAGVVDPKFHCSRCDNIFKIGETPESGEEDLLQEDHDAQTAPDQAPSPAPSEQRSLFDANSNHSEDIHSEGTDDEDASLEDSHVDATKSLGNVMSNEEPASQEAYQDTASQDTAPQDNAARDNDTSLMLEKLLEGQIPEPEHFKTAPDTQSSSMQPSSMQTPSTRIVEGSPLLDRYNAENEGSFEHSLRSVGESLLAQRSENPASDKSSQQTKASTTAEHTVENTKGNTVERSVEQKVAQTPKKPVTQEALPLSPREKQTAAFESQGPSQPRMAGSSLEELSKRDAELHGSSSVSGDTTVIRPQLTEGHARGLDTEPSGRSFVPPSLLPFVVFALPMLGFLCLLYIAGLTPGIGNAIASTFSGGLVKESHLPPPAGVMIENRRVESVALSGGRHVVVIRGTLRNGSTSTLKRVLLEGIALGEAGEIIAIQETTLGADLHGTTIRNLTPEMVVDLQRTIPARVLNLAPERTQEFAIALLMPQGARPHFYSARVYSVLK